MRFEKINKMQSDLKLISSVLLNFINTTDQKVSLVISGDLSHVHQKDGPYGYHDSGIKFDTIVKKWCLDPTTDKLQSLIELQTSAIACGMSGILIKVRNNANEY